MRRRPDIKQWLGRPASRRTIWGGFVAALVLTVALELVVEKHPYFGFDGTFGFAAWFGFAACAALVLVAKVLGVLLKRPESFYDD